jgi:hypothetical protein
MERGKDRKLGVGGEEEDNICFFFNKGSVERERAARAYRYIVSCPKLNLYCTVQYIHK